jgi:hypothetical protein
MPITEHKPDAEGFWTGEKEFNHLAEQSGLTSYELMLAFDFGVHHAGIFERKCKVCLSPVGRAHWSVQGGASYDACGDVRHREMLKCPLDKGGLVTMSDLSEKALNAQ